MRGPRRLCRANISFQGVELLDHIFNFVFRRLSNFWFLGIVKALPGAPNDIVLLEAEVTSCLGKVLDSRDFSEMLFRGASLSSVSSSKTVLLIKGDLFGDKSM
ncbi:hypothetical protein L6452_22569 [Arctium lappa]|uniref:Uncharacterized protein n=1 Tax=Arctium lappa TaxID=4217 RepID=A0ACB9B0Z1_ARCLA|nr:hypothetical protein L6452_22569 [Arctium lappa]